MAFARAEERFKICRRTTINSVCQEGVEKGSVDGDPSCSGPRRQFQRVGNRYQSSIELESPRVRGEKATAKTDTREITKPFGKQTRKSDTRNMELRESGCEKHAAVVASRISRSTCQSQRVVPGTDGSMRASKPSVPEAIARTSTPRSQSGQAHVEVQDINEVRSVSIEKW